MKLEAVLRAIEPVSTHYFTEAQAKHNGLTKPPGSLGQLEPIACRLAAIYKTLSPKVKGKGIAVFAADHGISEEGVSAYPKVVTKEMVLNFLRGGAAVNVLADVNSAELMIIDVGVDADFSSHAALYRRKVSYGSNNMLKGAAMRHDEVNLALQVGIEFAERLIDKGVNLVAGGDMGISNTTAATAITTVMTGSNLQDVTGYGTGISQEGLKHKIKIIQAVLAQHQLDPDDPLEVLRCVGGVEIAALTGFYLAAAARGVAILLDGFIVSAAALIAGALCPAVKDYLFASHCSCEPGHRVQLDSLGLSPLFDYGLRLGEGTGALLAMPILESAAAVLSEMASFAEAGVSGKR